LSEPNIKIPVDLTNPGQFFACCGLLELADRLWPGAEGLPGVYGWFEQRQFCIATEDQSKTLAELLTETRGLFFDVGDDSDAGNEDDDDKDTELPVEPIRLQWKKSEKLAIHLDWWSDKSLKPWAGRMEVRIVLRAMLDGIDPTSRVPFNDLKVAYYSSLGKKNPKKREPFYFDPRRGNKSHPLDCGFSPDTHKMEAECCPALEALCFIGLQRARPAPTGVANQSRYTIWPKVSDNHRGISANLVGAVACGILQLPGSTDYIFNNYFRTERRQYKTYSQATLERSLNV
jgi:CRISPR-associated protein Csx14